MRLAGLFSFLVPRDHKFFPLFIVAADNLVYTSELLVALLNEPDLERRQTLTIQIKEADLTRDRVTRKLIAELHHTFITPFDREDVYDIIHTIDGIVAHIYSASNRTARYKLAEFPLEFVRMAELIVASAKEIQNIIHHVHTVNDFQNHIESCNRIGEMESMVDDLYQQYLADLFEQEPNAVELIKKRDIVSSMEKAIDQCDEMAGIFFTIIVKMA